MPLCMPLFFFFCADFSILFGIIDSLFLLFVECCAAEYMGAYLEFQVILQSS